MPNVTRDYAHVGRLVNFALLAVCCFLTVLWWRYHQEGLTLGIQRAARTSELKKLAAHVSEVRAAISSDEANRARTPFGYSPSSIRKAAAPVRPITLSDPQAIEDPEYVKLLNTMAALGVSAEYDLFFQIYPMPAEQRKEIESILVTERIMMREAAAQRVRQQGEGLPAFATVTNAATTEMNTALGDEDARRLADFQAMQPALESTFLRRLIAEAKYQNEALSAASLYAVALLMRPPSGVDREGFSTANVIRTMPDSAIESARDVLSQSQWELLKRINAQRDQYYKAKK